MSPFEIFRRNLKPLMIFLTLLALMSFVVLPVVSDAMRQNNGGGSGVTVAKYSGKELSRSRVDYFTQNHYSLVGFLREMAEETIRRGGSPKVAGFGYNSQQKQITSLGINSQPSAEATVRTFMFADQAAQEGFELDDGALRNWLNQFTDQTMEEGELVSRLMNFTRNRMGRPHLYEQLRNHLLADVYLRRASSGFVSQAGALMTPDEQWENFLRLNQSATVTAYGVLVNDFLDQTNADPSASEIREVFEEGKERDPDDQSPEPAFHKPYAAEFEYLVGDYQKFLDIEIAKLSEDELQAEYQRRLKGGDFQIDELPETETADSSLDEMEINESAAETSKAPDPAKVKESNSAKEEAPMKEEAPEEDESSTETSAEPASEDQSGTPSKHAVRLVNFQNENGIAEDEAGGEAGKKTPEVPDAKAEMKAEPSEASPATDETSETSTTEKGAAADGAPAAAKVEATAEKMDQASKSVDAQQPTAESPQEQPADESGTETEEKTEPKTETFEDVRDEIAADLAGPAARTAMDNAITKVAGKMKKYFSKLALHKSNEAAGQVSEPPTRPNLEELGREYGMTRGTTEMATRTEISAAEISRSFDVGTSFGQRGIDFTNMMYGYATPRGKVAPKPIFSTIRFADDQAGLIYVAWKVAEREAYTPTLDEVREEVVAAIRMEEARGLAKAAAESLAEQVIGDVDFATLIPADRAENLKTGLGPFTWLNMVGFRQVTVGNVRELDSVGDAFMRTTFSTAVGSSAVAANQPQRVYYIIKPEKFDPPIDELKERFKQPINRMMSSMAGGRANEVIKGYYDATDAKLGYESFLGGNE